MFQPRVSGLGFRAWENFQIRGLGSGPVNGSCHSHSLSVSKRILGFRSQFASCRFNNNPSGTPLVDYSVGAFNLFAICNNIVAS